MVWVVVSCFMVLSLALAACAPRSGATTDRRPPQRLAVARALSTGRPALVQEPVLRRIGIVPADGEEGGSRDEPRATPERAQLRLGQLATLAARRDSRAPKNLIRHPVSNTRKSALKKKDRLDRRTAVSPNEFLHPRFGELTRMNFRPAGFPPARRVRAMMEADSAELPRIAENKRPLSLPEDNVIMFGRVKFLVLDSELPAHPEVNPDPVVARKLEEHLLAARS